MAKWLAAFMDEVWFGRMECLIKRKGFITLGANWYMMMICLNGYWRHPKTKTEH
jgi:hypothetical protein